MSASHFRELEVWRLSMELAKAVYRLTAAFPREEKYGLSAQMQRAAVSVASNIAEARESTREYAQFVSVGSGSVAELQTQLLLAQQLGLGGPVGLSEALVLCERVSKMLRRLQQALRLKLESGSRVPGPGSR